jgi:ABC-type amino acid transport substrate-binding protein
MSRRTAFPLVLALTWVLAGCSGAPAPPADAPPAADAPSFPLVNESGFPGALGAMIERPFTGDLDGMAARRMVRVGVTFNRTHYFIDQGTQRGISVAHMRQFESNLNAARRTGHLRIRVVFVPLSRDALLPALVSGRVDAVAAQLTITPERPVGAAGVRPGIEQLCRQPAHPERPAPGRGTVAGDDRRCS